MDTQLKEVIFSKVAIEIAGLGYSAVPTKLSTQAIATHGLRRGGIMFDKFVNGNHLLIYIYDWHVPQSLKCVIGWAPKPIIPAPGCAGQRASLNGVEFIENSFSLELFNLVDSSGEPLATSRSESEGWYLIQPAHTEFGTTEDIFVKMLSAQMTAIGKITQLDPLSLEASELCILMADRISNDLKLLADSYLMRKISD